MSYLRQPLEEVYEPLGLSSICRKAQRTLRSTDCRLGEEECNKASYNLLVARQLWLDSYEVPSKFWGSVELI